MPMGIGGIWAGRADAVRGTEEAVGGLRFHGQAVDLRVGLRQKGHSRPPRLIAGARACG